MERPPIIRLGPDISAFLLEQWRIGNFVAALYVGPLGSLFIQVTRGTDLIFRWTFAPRDFTDFYYLLNVVMEGCMTGMVVYMPKKFQKSIPGKSYKKTIFWYQDDDFIVSSNELIRSICKVPHINSFRTENYDAVREQIMKVWEWEIHHGNPDLPKGEKIKKWKKF